MGISKTHLYEQLLAAGFTKQEIHSVIYKRILHQIACKKAYQQLSLTGKIQCHIQHYSRQVEISVKVYHRFVAKFTTQLVA